MGESKTIRSMFSGFLNVPFLPKTNIMYFAKPQDIETNPRKHPKPFGNILFLETSAFGKFKQFKTFEKAGPEQSRRSVQPILGNLGDEISIYQKNMEWPCFGEVAK